jgi:hypothetical protein
MRAIIVVTLVIAVCAGADRGWAQGDASGDKVAAEQLFVEGRALMDQQQFEAACPKLQASLELDPASGTQINLARCYEKLGKLATAWRHYREASDRAVRDGNTARAQVARKLAAELEPRLPRLIITLRSPAGAQGSQGSQGSQGLIVRRDGMPVPAALFGTAVYVDPGPHEVTATAPGRAPFSATVTVAEAATSTVEIPELAPAPPATGTTAPDAPASPDSPGSRDWTPAAGGRTPAAGPSGRVDAGRAGPRTASRRRVAGLITGGAGLVALGIGLGIGATASSTWNDAFDSGLCDRDTLQCTVEGRDQVDTARSRARVSSIVGGVGVAAAVTGAVLYFTAPRQARRTTRLVPWTHPGDFGVAIVGGF